MAKRNLTKLLATVSFLSVLFSPVQISASGYVTYFSGNDVVLSPGEGVLGFEGRLSNISYATLSEDFGKPPYSTADQWAGYNGWKYSGSCPSWSGIIWCGVTESGYLQWHNWFHAVGGSVYNFFMWKDLEAVEPYFELYVPISTAHPSGSGIAGSPELHVYVELYDGKGTKIFSSDIVYNNPVRRIVSWMYGANKTVDNLWLSSLNIKLWQNSTGAYFSYDNGTSVMMSGTFYTPPTRVQIRFYIWEYNSIQPYSDYEYWINIDKVILRTLNSDNIVFSGLPAGNWSLIDLNGRQAFAVNSTLHGTSFSFQYSPPICDEFNDGAVGCWEAVNLATIYESGGYLVTTAKPNTWGSWAGSRCAIGSPQEDFQVEASVSYIGELSDLAEIYLALLDAAGSVVAYAGVSDCWAGSNPQWACGATEGSSWATGANTLPGTGALVIRIERAGSTWTFKSSGSYSGTWMTAGSTMPIRYILLTNTRYYSYNGKTAQWDYVRTNIPSKSQPFNGTLVGLVDWVYVKRGTFYANTILTYCDKGNYFIFTQTENQPYFIIRGVPVNDIVRVYQGDLLKKIIVSTGTDILVKQSEIPLPFTGAIEVISRPYLRAVSTYSGTLDWNDMLAYSGDILTKQSTGIQPQEVSAGSECSATTGWTLSYNLISGGATPTFSSSSGHVRFDETRLSYYYPWEPWSYVPIMEAWYYLKYDVNSIVRNLTLSVAADGSFTYYAAADKLLEGWGEIILYVVRGSNWTQIAQSGKSTSPSLSTTVSNLYSTSFTTVDMVVVAFHTYARAREGYGLYSNPQWGRVDYLRLGFYKIPEWYSGVNVTGLTPGWRVRFGSYECWADLTGRATIPINASTWPSASSITVYPPTFSHTDLFAPGCLYYLFVNKSYVPSVDTLYYEVSTVVFSYKAEFSLVSLNKIPTKSGVTYEMIFKYTDYENGNPLERLPKSILIDGVPVAISSSNGVFSAKFSTLSHSGYVSVKCIDTSGICLSGKVKIP